MLVTSSSVQRRAGRLLRRIRERLGHTLGVATGRARQSRLEPFGAIVQLAVPRALVFVDRARARALGLVAERAPTVWRDPADDGAVGRSVLSAPLEAHLQITNRCGAGCRGCYTGATRKGDADEWGLDEWRRAVDTLAEMGVFHLALGGGESASVPWLGDLAAHARSRGLIPNLTTSGLEGLQQLLPIAHLFGQINVSMDGMRAGYRAVRGFDGFSRADRAVRELRARKREIGINVVLTRHNFDDIDALFGYARARRLNEIEILRFKPAGRGTRAFAATTCTDAQHRALLPTLMRATRRHRVRVRVDCSYTPMLVHHRPDREFLASLAVYGCTGGDFLIGAKADGSVTACSFAAPPGDRPDITRLPEYWRRDDAFPPFRQFRDADEPCRSCSYHELCRGGCRVVSAHVLGDPRRPDPECPRVIDWRETHSGNGSETARTSPAQPLLPLWEDAR